MKSPSNESFHSTRSQPPSIAGSPPPETISHMNAKLGIPLKATLTVPNVGLLNTKCQTLGFSARYEIDGDQPIGFGGYLQLGPHTITRDERWPSKKAAKEGLAQKGLAIVGDLQKRKAVEEVSLKNWVGMLHSFYQRCGQSGDRLGPIFTEYTIGSLHACTCLISLDPTPFGSESIAFTNKKAAKTSAAREAMEFLISLGYATSDGKPGPNIQPEPTARKRRKIGTKSSGSVDGIAPALNNIDAPFAQKVNELCPLLGLKAPQYRLEATGSSLYSGSAYFSDEPLLRDPIGEVENIFGKKNAKEESARGVWKVLIALAAQRGISGRAIDEDQDSL